LMLMALPASAVKFDTSGTGSPLRKVIKLIEGMQSKLEMEGEQDKTVYDKQACWCTTNIDEKTNSIDTGNKRIKYLENSVVMLASESAKLEMEVTLLEKDITADTASLAESTALRKNEKTAFMAKEKEAMDTLEQLVEAKKAVQTAPSAEATATTSVAGFIQTQDIRLTTQGPGAELVQRNSASVKALLTKLQKKVAKAATLLAENHRSNVDEFLNSDIGASKGGIFLQRQKSGPDDSQAALGVLEGLTEDFVFNLADLRTQETKRLLEYNKMSKAKTAEIKAMEEQKTNNGEAKSDADQKRSDNKKEIKSTKEQVAEDEEFLADAKEKCRLIDKEWMERSKARATEAEVLDKTKKIMADQYEKNDALNSFVQEDGETKPSNLNNFWGSFSAPAFLQESSESGLRARASKTLMEAGRLDSRLVTLALEAKLDSFRRVKKAIQELVDALKKEQADEVTKKDWCIAEMQENEMETQEQKQKMELQIAAIAEMAASITAKKEDASTLNAEIAELNKQMKLAAENREEENKEYQEMIKDQRETQQALGMALAVLRGFYPEVPKKVEAEEAALVQTDGGDPMPEGFKPYKKSQGGGGIMELMQQLLEDSKLIEAQGLQAESESQADYEDFTKKSVTSVHSKSKAIRERDTARSKKEIEKSEKTEGRDLSISMITQLELTMKQLHDTCDFVLAQFTNRQKARSDEMDALGEAMAILSGSSQGSD